MIKATAISIVVFLAFVIFKQENDLSRYRTLREILMSENRILKDQLHDVEFTLTSSKSYEDGLAQGVKNAESTQYMLGYHVGISQNNSPELYSESK